MAERKEKLSLLWTKHLGEDKEKESFAATVKHSGLVLGRLRQIICEKIKTAESMREAKDRYTNAAWPYQQADYNGTIRALKEVADLLPKE